MAKSLNLTGKHFGRLIAVERGPDYIRVDGGKAVRWKCKCECGNEKLVWAISLRNGNTKSCGCIQREFARKNGRKQVRHGHLVDKGISREYSSWSGMLTRCYNPTHGNYRLYGGRGIGVCERWRHSFDNFFEDMGARPPLRTLDRIDVNGDYSRENCRWATAQEQQGNRRNCVFFTIGGIRRSLAEWCEIAGVKKVTVKTRIRRGKSPEEALGLISDSETDVVARFKNAMTKEN